MPIQEPDGLQIPAFAEAVAAAGLVFVGPPAAAIRAIGSKRLAKLRMLEAGVPCIPGYSGADQSVATLVREAERMGFPLLSATQERVEPPQGSTTMMVLTPVTGNVDHASK